MPPMLPIWRSTMTRSGSCSSTAGATAWPESTSMMSVSGSPTTATTSARTDGASLATTIVRTASG